MNDVHWSRRLAEQIRELKPRDFQPQLFLVFPPLIGCGPDWSFRHGYNADVAYLTVETGPVDPLLMLGFVNTVNDRWFARSAEGHLALCSFETFGETTRLSLALRTVPWNVFVRPDGSRVVMRLGDSSLPYSPADFGLIP